jgi:hypothetical protein
VCHRITVVVFFPACMYIWGRGVQNIDKIGVYFPPHTLLATRDVLLCCYWLLDEIKGQVYKWILFTKDLNWIMISQWDQGEYTGVEIVEKKKLVYFRFEWCSRNVHRRYASQALANHFPCIGFVIFLDHSWKILQLFFNYQNNFPRIKKKNSRKICFLIAETDLYFRKSYIWKNSRRWKTSNIIIFTEASSSGAIIVINERGRYHATVIWKPVD